MKKYLELNLKFNGNMALASNSFSKALAEFDMNCCQREEEDCKGCSKNERQGDEVYNLCRNLQGILPCGQQNCWFGCTVCIENAMDDHCETCINN